MELTKRQMREKEYYNQYSQSFDIETPIDYAPVLGPWLETERRPWNSYWRTYEIPIDYLRKKNKKKNDLRLLDFGCGPGDNSARFSQVGFNITGFDICEKNISKCNELFSKNNLKNNSKFLVSTAEDLPFPNESFEIIVGIDILHHVDIFRSIREIKRVLKDDGIAIFREPIEVPLFDVFRNLRFIRRFFPNDASIEVHITEDEKKLNQNDIDIIKDTFPEMIIERSLVFSRFDRFIRSSKSPAYSFLERVDYFFVKTFPVFQKFGGAAVIILRKKMV